jgi:hypothetical protein
MIKIMYICNWGESPEDLLLRYSKQTPESSNIWKNIQGTTNPDEVDYFIVLDGIGNIDFSVDPDKVIFIKREAEYIEKYQRPNYKHVRNYDNGAYGITWWIGNSYNELKNMEYPKDEKTKDCSLIIRYKYPHRQAFLNNLFSKPTGIDLYGFDHPKFADYKGIINSPDGKCKMAGIKPYKYSIALTNSQQLNYFSEKICDIYLGWGMPIYWGCPNIGDFFPEKSFRVIDCNDPNVNQRIKEIINTPLTEEDIEAIGEARRLVLEKYNLWEIVKEEVDKAEETKKVTDGENILKSRA